MGAKALTPTMPILRFSAAAARIDSIAPTRSTRTTHFFGCIIGHSLSGADDSIFQPPSSRVSSPPSEAKGHEMSGGSNITAKIPYDDLREWLDYAERLGEVRNIKGASWQEDIGLAAEAVLRAENGPCVVFDDIPGCAKGFRLLLNVFAGTRRNMTLGFPDHLTKGELSEAYRDA